jgi:hypothetical protein
MNRVPRAQRSYSTSSLERQNSRGSYIGSQPTALSSIFASTKVIVADLDTEFTRVDLASGRDVEKPALKGRSQP